MSNMFASLINKAEAEMASASHNPPSPKSPPRDMERPSECEINMFVHTLMEENGTTDFLAFITLKKAVNTSIEDGNSWEAVKASLKVSAADKLDEQPEAASSSSFIVPTAMTRTPNHINEDDDEDFIPVIENSSTRTVYDLRYINAPQEVVHDDFVLLRELDTLHELPESESLSSLNTVNSLNQDELRTTSLPENMPKLNKKESPVIVMQALWQVGNQPVFANPDWLSESESEDSDDFMEYDDIIPFHFDALPPALASLTSNKTLSEPESISRSPSLQTDDTTSELAPTLANVSDQDATSVASEAFADAEEDDSDLTTPPPAVTYVAATTIESTEEIEQVVVATSPVSVLGSLPTAASLASVLDVPATQPPKSMAEVFAAAYPWANATAPLPDRFAPVVESELLSVNTPTPEPSVLEEDLTSAPESTVAPTPETATPTPASTAPSCQSAEEVPSKMSPKPKAGAMVHLKVFAKKAAKKAAKFFKKK